MGTTERGTQKQPCDRSGELDPFLHPGVDAEHLSRVFLVLGADSPDGALPAHLGLLVLHTILYPRVALQLRPLGRQALVLRHLVRDAPAARVLIVVGILGAVGLGGRPALQEKNMFSLSSTYV